MDNWSSRCLILNKTVYYIGSIFLLFAVPSCGPSHAKSDLHASEVQNPVYELGVAKGRMLERRDGYLKALEMLHGQRSEIDESFESMEISDIKAYEKLNDFFENKLNLFDVSPVNDTVAIINGIKGNLDKTVAVIRLVEGLEPIFASYIESVEAFNVLHAEAFGIFGELGAVIPFVRWGVMLADKIVQEAVYMQVSVTNVALFETVAARAVRANPISIRTWEAGFFSGYQAPSKPLLDWFTYNPFFEMLEKITDKPPPLAKWRCIICSNNVDNLENANAIDEYLEQHHELIFIALDELRIANGPQSFPLFMGPVNGLTNVGASRSWRKPKVLAKLDAEIASVQGLIAASEEIAVQLDDLVGLLAKSKVER